MKNEKNISMLDELISESTSDLEEVVIGIVGAIGSNINVLQNILKTELEDTFNFDVFVIKVSEDILKNHPNVTSVDDYDLTTKYKRINSLMNLGNKLREFYGLDYISLEVAVKIRDLRKSYTGSKKRVAYIIDSLKHDAEVVSLKKLYGNTFFQISIFESEKKRKDTLNNNIGMTVEEAEKLIIRDEKEDEKWGQRTSVAFPLADYFVKFDDKTGVHINNAINRFIKLILGNVYITGQSYGGTSTSYDFATIKYNSSGILQWEARYNGTGNGNDGANAVTVDQYFNVYVTGYSVGAGSSLDYTTIKYNSSGVQQWIAKCQQPSHGQLRKLPARHR